jgi:hypothetical protein
MFGVALSISLFIEFPTDRDDPAFQGPERLRAMVVVAIMIVLLRILT